MFRFSLTVLFEPPFWIGLYERTEGGRYEVCKITFGAEPKDYDVYEFLLRHWHDLRFSPSVPVTEPPKRKISPKRLQRQIRRETAGTGIGTKAQQTLQLQRERNKAEREARSKTLREAEKQKRYDLRQEKKKQKRRGR